MKWFKKTEYSMTQKGIDAVEEIIKESPFYKELEEENKMLKKQLDEKKELIKELTRYSSLRTIP